MLNTIITNYRSLAGNASVFMDFLMNAGGRWEANNKCTNNNIDNQTYTQIQVN
jgi:hypothetical protein